MAGEGLGGDRTTVIATPDGRELSFCVWGDPAGAPVFLMHGTPGSRMLRHPTDTHRRDGVAVCVYDRPGYGRSQRRAGRSHAQTVDEVAAIAAALGWEQFAVAGPSAGSGPCLAVAALLPHRVTRCALIVGAAPPTDSEIQAGMSPDDHADWEPALRGDEEALAREFDGFLQWFDAGMPGSGANLLDPLVGIKRAHLELYIRHLGESGLRVSSVNTMMHGVRGFFRFAHIDGLITADPAVYARLPKIHTDESRTQGLDRLELIRFLQVAQTLTVHHGALAYLLGNAIRASGAAAVRIEDYAETLRGHRVLHLVG